MLEIRTVSKTFNPGTPNELHALQAVNLTVNDGSFVVIIGTNGSGKSTLLNAVAGSFCVDSGAIFLTGADITKWPEHKRAKLIGRVFQNPFSGTAANMSIAENLALAAYRGKPRRLGWPLRKHLLSQLRDRVSQLNMGLEDRLKNPIGSLSGGQRQALTLLMATWLRPEVLLLDEHTAALDPKSADQVIALTATITASTSDKPDSAARSSLLRSTRNRIYYVCHCSPPLVGTIELYRTFDPGWSATLTWGFLQGCPSTARCRIGKR